MMLGAKGLSPHELAPRWVKDLVTRPDTVSYTHLEGITVKTAMFADINGISMGQRDAMLANGVEFLYTNIHTHHGMYCLLYTSGAQHGVWNSVGAGTCLYADPLWDQI